LSLTFSVAVDLVEIHVNDVGPDRVALDLANQRLHRLAVHRQLDDRARRLDRQGAAAQARFRARSRP